MLKAWQPADGLLGTLTSSGNKLIDPYLKALGNGGSRKKSVLNGRVDDGAQPWGLHLVLVPSSLTLYLSLVSGLR